MVPFQVPATSALAPMGGRFTTVPAGFTLGSPSCQMWRGNRCELFIRIERLSNLQELLAFGASDTVKLPFPIPLADELMVIQEIRAGLVTDHLVEFGRSIVRVCVPPVCGR